jgi:hypothetical protein
MTDDKWQHHVYLSNGMRMTAAEYRAAIESGDLQEMGYDLLMARRHFAMMEESFRQTKEIVEQRARAKQ